jgi:uncharacterized protein
MKMKSNVLAALALAALLAGCNWEPGAGPTRAEADAWDRVAVHSADPVYQNEIRDWQAKRAESLRRDTGWLTLTGLVWLDEGESRIGSAAGSEVRLPEGKAPETVGTLVRTGRSVTLTTEPGAMVTVDGTPVGSIEMKPDTSGSPTIAEIGPVQFLVIERGDRVGVRVRDREHPALASFRGLDYFPTDPGWRVEARLEPYDPPKQIPIQNVVGIVEAQLSPGALVFEIDGKEHRLDPIIEEGTDELFVIFADETSGGETYGAGRYLYAKNPGPNGRTTLDFNKAYNPPCAFTDFATCPLPPRQNRLEVRVEAGEKNYHQ